MTKFIIFDTNKKQSKGLTFCKVQPNTAYFFFKPSSCLIHMFFVFYKLDIIYLDDSYEIIKIRKNVLPFTPLVFPPKGAKHFIEMRSL